MEKNLKNRFHVLQRADFLIRLINGEGVDDLISGLSAFQLKDLRDFLENELLFVTSLDGGLLDRDIIKSRYPSVHDYFYAYDCREELDDCYNETCLDINPNCFSRKMEEQIKVLLNMLTPYLVAQKRQEFQYEEV